jgi:hypothetical protein
MWEGIVLWQHVTKEIFCPSNVIIAIEIIA